MIRQQLTPIQTYSQVNETQTLDPGVSHFFKKTFNLAAGLAINISIQILAPKLQNGCE